MGKAPTFNAEAALLATAPLLLWPRHWPLYQSPRRTMPGPTSKASRELAGLRLQLKKGKTRKGRPLAREEITALEQRRDRVVAEMRAEKQKKFIASITNHTTSEADRVIREVPQAVQKCIAEELDKRLGPAAASAMEEALAERARANKRIRELRKEEKNKPTGVGTSSTEPARDVDAADASGDAVDDSGAPPAAPATPPQADSNAAKDVEERPAKRHRAERPATTRSSDAGKNTLRKSQGELEVKAKLLYERLQRAVQNSKMAEQDLALAKEARECLWEHLCRKVIL